MKVKLKPEQLIKAEDKQLAGYRDWIIGVGDYERKCDLRLR